MDQLTTVGIELAKDVFAICVLGATDAVLQRRVLRRDAFMRWAEQLSPGRVAMEACGSSRHWGRWFSARGHIARLIPPESVKPFRPAVPAASCWHTTINVLRMAVHRIPVGLREGQTCRIRRAIGDIADAGCIVLCCYLGLSSLNLRRISGVVTIARMVTGVFELDQFGAYLCSGDRRIRLGKHGNRSGKGSGNDNGLNKRPS